MPEHSPTPWKIARAPESCYIHDANDVYISKTLLPRGETEGVFEIRRANAAHIVHCVNLHDELVAETEALVGLFENWRDGIFARQGIKWIEEPPAIIAARAILAKAKAK